jgi:hypothetical protein
MIQSKDYEKVQKQLEACLSDRFPDAAVQIGENIHYQGVNVVVTSMKFQGLLSEQRFHHVVRLIPKELYEKYFQKGVVWFELAPGESGKDLMRMARAADVAGAEETAIRRMLDESKLFKKLTAYYEAEDDEEPSGMTFDVTKRILTKSGLTAAQVERCLLYMILKGAYCDAHVVQDLLPKYAAEHAA